MTKRNADMFIYDPEKNYDLADFENTTIKTVSSILNEIINNVIEKCEQSIKIQNTIQTTVSTCTLSNRSRRY